MGKPENSGEQTTAAIAIDWSLASALMTGEAVQVRAYRDFDAWLEQQPDTLQEQTLLEQIDTYAKAHADV